MQYLELIALSPDKRVANTADAPFSGAPQGDAVKNIKCIYLSTMK